MTSTGGTSGTHEMDGTTETSETLETGAAPGVAACSGRRAVVAGVFAGGALVLGACGMDDEAGGGGGSTGTGDDSDEDDGGGGGGGGSTVPVSDVPEGGGTVVDGVVVTQPTAGEFKAFDATCPHQGCTVDTITADAITCPCHGSQFDPSTGDVTNGPAESGLEAREASVDGDTITIS